MSKVPVRPYWPSVFAVALGLALLPAPPAGAGGFVARSSMSPRVATSGGGVLLAYLNAVDKARAPYLVAGPAADAALQRASRTPDATWVTAAAKTKAAEKAASRLEGAVKSLTPPPGLAQANQALAQSARLAVQTLGQLSSALSARNVPAVNTALTKVPTLTVQVHALELKWRTAITAAANKDGVTVPSWVVTLGTT